METDEIEVGTFTGTKRIVIVRHGQGFHNRGAGWLRIATMLLKSDARLTPAGQAQARAVRDAAMKDPAHPINGVEVVLCSPLSRAVETALLVFGDGDSPPRCLAPLAAERCVLMCDVGRAPAELATTFPEVKDWEGFGDLDERWWWDDNKSVRKELWPVERAEEFKRTLMARREQSIAVVGHAGFFKCLCGEHMNNCGVAVLELDGRDGSLRVVKPTSCDR
eukprot:TRINITY_DN68286_c0_g1_i1.p1 TRINITY_DN68286_c0_g1~~TRINITY_DN68286_c0_g1_i1.p1  ORF type:complete len:241 (+),score=32.95 TRINITY_DN68286_c0_g1_i1:62-724(+)